MKSRVWIGTIAKHDPLRGWAYPPTSLNGDRHGEEEKTRKAAKAIKRKQPAAKTKKAKRPAAKKAVKRSTRKTKDVTGEGNYTAARNFRKKETDFIRGNRSRIAAKAKEAEAALEGPEGAELRRAEEESARGQM